MPKSSLVSQVLAVLAVLVFALPAVAQPPVGDSPPPEAAADAAPSPLAVAAVRVTPSPAAPDTLVRLSVDLENRGERPASLLGFAVALDGEPLPVYANQLYLHALPPGETTTLALYNFWTSETGRPAPADGELTVEVSLVEARWMTVGDEDGVETWTPGDAVPGLPVAGRATLPVPAPKPPAPPSPG